ncbi:MAG: flippase-like domain-containing protein [Prevotellaceae bacterium]|jgi:hypothetical protein|nr:flippase-like domain-containing protein [Prevotellaceae bacterium]
MNKHLYTYFKWLLAVLAYAFLLYKLITFDKYAELVTQWQLIGNERYVWLLMLVALLPFNLLIEAWKWQLLTRKTENISLKVSFKAVLVGISTGFFTPNRIGEPVGRMLFLQPENRRKGLAMGFVGSLTQNLTVLLFGIPAFVLFLSIKDNTLNNNYLPYLTLTAISLIVLLVFYFYLPTISRKTENSARFSKLKKYLASLKNFTTVDLFAILCVSALRFLVFCLQFYMMMQFWGINLSLIHSFTGICTNYLFITFTPAFSFSEAAVRGSFAVLVFSVFSPQIANIAFCGISIWLINTVLPVMVGNIFLLKNKK